MFYELTSKKKFEIILRRVPTSTINLLHRQGKYMPFSRSKAQNSRSTEDREPLLRLGGLWTSKTGKALTGNVNLDYAKEGEDSVGEQLMSLLTQAKQEGKPLRFLVFEDDGKFASRAPFSLHVTLGMQKPEEQEQPTRESAPQAPRRWGPPPETDASVSDTVESTPRPMRRTAPRR